MKGAGEILFMGTLLLSLMLLGSSTHGPVAPAKETVSPVRIERLTPPMSRSS